MPDALRENSPSRQTDDSSGPGLLSQQGPCGPPGAGRQALGYRDRAMRPMINEAVQATLDELVGGGVERGLQAAAYLDGELVLDAWAGVADASTGRLVNGDSLHPAAASRHYSRGPVRLGPHLRGHLFTQSSLEARDAHRVPRADLRLRLGELVRRIDGRPVA